jgi:hypothetical protein
LFLQTVESLKLFLRDHSFIYLSFAKSHHL